MAAIERYFKAALRRIVLRELTLGSLFDGLGGWLLAAKENGIRPIWSSEIDDFPMAVSKYHFPEVQQLGDITKLDGAELPPVDIICAGSPCQDLSIAGKREGLAGERSGLFRKAIDIVRGMRKATNGEYPKWFVWENVPGAFSSNKGHDFRAVLEEITETDIPMPDSGRWSKGGLVRSPKCNVAWRTLDAQYWGVPQRRARIFLIAGFGADSRPEVLFEPESLFRNTESGGKEGQGTAAGAENNIRTTSSFESGIVNEINVVSMGHDERSAGFIPNIADPLTASDYKQPPVVACIGNGQCNQLSLQDKIGALNCMHDQQAIITASEHKSMIQEAVYAIDRAAFNQGKNAKYNFSIDRGAKPRLS